MADGGAVVTVEELAQLHYASGAGGGWSSLHTEGSVWSTLWGLLMWDVVFAPLPEVFRWVGTRLRLCAYQQSNRPPSRCF